MRFHLVPHGQPAGAQPARSSCGHVWLRTPAMMSAFLTLSWAIAQLPLHPFLSLATIILIPPAFSLLGPLVLPARIRGPIDGLAYGSSFALIGGTQVWWLLSLLNNSAQQNKLALAVGMGLFALAFLVVGSSIVAAVLLYWGEARRSPEVEGEAK